MKTVEEVQNFIKKKTSITFEISEPPTSLIPKEAQEPVALADVQKKLEAQLPAPAEGYVQVRIIVSIT